MMSVIPNSELGAAAASSNESDGIAEQRHNGQGLFHQVPLILNGLVSASRLN